MKKSLRPISSRALAELRCRLAEAEETLRAIQAGEIDAVVVQGKQGPQVYTLEGAEHVFRMLIESMNEGALTLMENGVILYANRRFATMVKRPLELVMGESIYRFLPTADHAMLRPLLMRADTSGSSIHANIHVSDGTYVPARLSIGVLDKNGSKTTTFGIVVTDMTEARLIEETLRGLTHRLVQNQEAERGKVALTLHDNITQLLCAIIVRSQTLAQTISKRNGPSKQEALALRELLGNAATEVESISRSLRPGVLSELGLVAVLRDYIADFTKRTHVSAKLLCEKVTVRLPADIELALYRIFQKALNNVEAHAKARHISASLVQQKSVIHMTISDDGVGFDSGQQLGGRQSKYGYGLLRMRERALAMGGTLSVTSVRGFGTTIKVRIPTIRISEA